MSKGIVIQSGAREIVLRFDVNALALAEEKTGKTLRAIITESASGDLSFGLLRAVFMAGLRHADPTMTIDRAGSIMQNCIDNGVDIAVLATKVSEAIFDSGVFGKLVKQEGGEGEAPAQDPPAAPTA